MSQYDFGNLESPVSGTELINTHFEPWRNALHSLHSGASRPSYAVAGMQWINTTTNPWVLNIFDGADDIPLGTINTSTNAFTPSNVTPVAGSISNSQLATMTANSVKVNNTGSTASPSDVAMSASTILARLASGNIVAATVSQIKTLLALVAADISNLGTAALATIGTSGATLGLLNTVNAYGGQQNFAAAAITSTSNSMAWNLSTAQFAKHTFTENTTLANPTNMVDGGTYVLKLTQHASSPKTLAFGSAYKWSGGVAPTISNTNGAVDILTFVSDGTYMYGVGQLAFS